MKLWDIVKTVGSGIISATVPGGAAIIGAVNAVLPDDKKLPESATGEDINHAISSLPPESQVEILNKEFDVEITQIKESNSTLRAMLESDAQNPQSTRPYIAKNSFHVVAFAVIVSVSIWSYGVLSDNDELVETVMSGWPFILSVIGPLVTLLWSYFGIIKQEHKDRLNAASGNDAPSGLTGILSALMNRR